VARQTELDRTLSRHSTAIADVAQDAAERIGQMHHW
jgi:hypothetical protein